MSVKANDGRELGKLVGFVVDPDAHRINSLVVDSGAGQLEVPMGPLQLDPQGRSLKMVDCTADTPTVFSAGTIPVIEDAELWVPVFHSAA
jgi:hypothetical protein